MITKKTLVLGLSLLPATLSAWEYNFLELLSAYGEHKTSLENRPNTKEEWLAINDKKIQHLLETMQPTAENDDDRDYWRTQMQDIIKSIHYRYKQNDPLENALLLEKSTPIIAASILGIAALLRAAVWFMTPSVPGVRPANARNGNNVVQNPIPLDQVMFGGQGRHLGENPPVYDQVEGQPN